jgi:plastocyanin
MSRLNCGPVAPLGVFFVAVLLGCGGGGDSGPPPGDMTTVSKTSTASGDAQTGPVRQPLASPLQVVVTNDGQPSSGVMVTWGTTATGGSMSPPSGPTNADGVASASWTLGTVSGAQTATATVPGAAGSPVTFTATAAAGSAATLTKDPAGDNQTAEIGTQLALPVQTRVTDEHGNGVAGTVVGWGATGATVSSSAVPSATSGISAVTVIAGGTAGPIIITATADGLEGSPVTFNATAVTPAPIPTTASVRVGNNFFQSNRNSTNNPAVDTVQTGGTVTWTWVAGAVVHNVDSQGSPSFQDSPLQTGPSYSFTFSTAGTYQYTCAAHPGQMTGRIVVR